LKFGALSKTFSTKKNFIDENKSIEKLEETLLIDKDEFIPSDFLKQFNVSKHLMKDYLQILENSLENIFQKSSRKFCLLKGLEETHVTATPTGKEFGTYVALDLGGTNFRIMLVDITIRPENQSNHDRRHSISMDSQEYFVPQSVMLGTGVQLFDFIVNNLFEFLDTRKMTEMISHLKIGFTFSFPTKVTDQGKTVLTKWSKGYKCSGVVGNDIAQMLHEAIVRKFGENCNDIPKAVIVNDTVGTMIAAGHENNNVSIGLIVGTGLNICYMESQNKIDNKNKEGNSEHCINTEIGQFGDGSNIWEKIETIYDINLDKNSKNVGIGMLEKKIGGMWIGELARLVILDLHRRKIMFRNIEKESMLFKEGLSTAFISQLTQEEMDNEEVRDYLMGFGLNAYENECKFIVDLCHTLSDRAARLCAVGLAGTSRRIANHRNSKLISIGVDGTVYKKHPTFSNLLSTYLKELTPDLDYNFVISADGSGKGAALVAALKHKK